MAFIGTITSGPDADSYRYLWPANITVPSGATSTSASSSATTISGSVTGQLVPGTPLRRLYTSIQGRSPQTAPYSGVQGVGASLVGGDAAAFPTSNTVATTGAGTGYIYGIYAPPGGVVNNATTAAFTQGTPYVARTGIVPVVCAAVNGGTAITVGSLVGLSTVTIGTSSLQNQLTYNSSFTFGQTAGIVTGYALGTTLGPNAVAAGSATFNPPNAAGFSTSQAITINPGAANQETVVPSAFTAGTAASNTITFTTTATGAGVCTVTIGGIPTIGTVVLAVTIGATNTVNQSAVAVANAINQFLASFVAPANIIGVGGVLPLAYVAAPGAGAVTLAASYPGTWGNSLTLSATTTATTQTVAVGGASFSGGVNNSATATFTYAHVANEPIVGTISTSGTSILAVPSGTSAANYGLVMVDLIGCGA